MKVVVQRALNASVHVDNQLCGHIDKGFVLLVGVGLKDTTKEADYLAKKIAQLRVFEDENGKMNNDIKKAQGAILSISQFTLYADTKKGNRPSFVYAAPPQQAEVIYDYFNAALRKNGLHVETGVFGGDMQVNFINDGPVTIVYDTDV